MKRWSGYKFDKNTFVNRAKSINPLAKLSYKELQTVAFQHHLPANLQHKVLLAEIIAKNIGRDDIVNIIVKTSRRKRNKMPSSDSGFGSTQQQPMTSLNVSQDANNFGSSNPIPEARNLKDDIATGCLDDSMSSTLINNDVFFSINPTTNLFTDDTYAHKNIKNPSGPEVNIEEMFIPAAVKLNYSTISEGDVASSDTNLQFKTPSCSFDSGIVSFASADAEFEDVDLQEFLNSSQLGSIPIPVEDQPEISLVEILETLSENH